MRLSPLIDLCLLDYPSLLLHTITRTSTGMTRSFKIHSNYQTKFHQIGFHFKDAQCLILHLVSTRHPRILRSIDAEPPKGLHTIQVLELRNFNTPLGGLPVPIRNHISPWNSYMNS